MQFVVIVSEKKGMELKYYVVDVWLIRSGQMIEIWQMRVSHNKQKNVSKVIANPPKTRNWG